MSVLVQIKSNATSSLLTVSVLQVDPGQQLSTHTVTVWLPPTIVPYPDEGEAKSKKKTHGLRYLQCRKREGKKNPSDANAITFHLA